MPRWQEWLGPTPRNLSRQTNRTRCQFRKRNGPRTSQQCKPRDSSSIALDFDRDRPGRHPVSKVSRHLHNFLTKEGWLGGPILRSPGPGSMVKPGHPLIGSNFEAVPRKYVHNGFLGDVPVTQPNLIACSPKQAAKLGGFQGVHHNLSLYVLPPFFTVLIRVVEVDVSSPLQDPLPLNGSTVLAVRAMDEEALFDLHRGPDNPVKGVPTPCCDPPNTFSVRSGDKAVLVIFFKGLPRHPAVERLHLRVSDQVIPLDPPLLGDWTSVSAGLMPKHSAHCFGTFFQGRQG